MAQLGHYRIGIDLGGTKTEIILLAPDGGECFRQRRATPDKYPASLANMQALIQCTLDEVPEAQRQGTTIGIATPGAISPATGLIKNSNSVCLIGQALDRDLAELIGRPLRLANDADCFALSEATDGAAAGAKSVFGVILGTGTGGGVVVNGALLAGPNAIAGEWGHNPLPWPRDTERPGPACYCGKQGCIETFLSGPGLAADHERRSGERLSAQQIAARIGEQGDAADACRQSLALYADRLARGLASVINVLDPEVIVLGGGLSNIEWLYQAVIERWGDYVFSDAVATRLVKAQYGDSSGVRGAAWLWGR